MPLKGRKGRSMENMKNAGGRNENSAVDADDLREIGGELLAAILDSIFGESGKAGNDRGNDDRGENSKVENGDDESCDDSGNEDGEEIKMGREKRDKERKQEMTGMGEAVCRDPYQSMMVFIPGEGAKLVMQQDGIPMILKGGSHQVVHRVDPFENDGYLISYDNRHIRMQGKNRFITGPVYLIALGKNDDTRDMNRADICCLCHLLEPAVVESDDRQYVLIPAELWKSAS